MGYAESHDQALVGDQTVGEPIATCASACSPFAAKQLATRPGLSPLPERGWGAWLPSRVKEEVGGLPNAAAPHLLLSHPILHTPLMQPSASWVLRCTPA